MDRRSEFPLEAMNLQQQEAPKRQTDSRLGSWVRATDLASDDAIAAALPWCGVRELEAASNIEEALSRWPDKVVLLIVSDPLVGIAARIDGGEPIEKACDEWRSLTEGLLRSVRRARKRVAVVDIDMLTSKNHPKWTELRDRFGLDEPSSNDCCLSYTDVSADSRVFAGILILSDLALLEITEEIRASTIGTNPDLSYTALVNESIRHKSSISQEIGLLRQTVAKQIDALADLAALAEKRIELLRRDLAVRDKERAVLKSTVAELRTQQTQMRSQALQMQGDIEQLRGEVTERELLLAKLRTENIEQTSANSTLSNDLLAVRTELMQVYNSRSWRLTKVLRNSRRLFGSKLRLRPADSDRH